MDRLDIYRDIARNYNQQTPEEIAQRLGLSRAAINLIAGKLRKRGVPLVVRKPVVKKIMTDEFIAELKTLVV